MTCLKNYYTFECKEFVYPYHSFNFFIRVFGDGKILGKFIVNFSLLKIFFIRRICTVICMMRLTSDPPEVCNVNSYETPLINCVLIPVSQYHSYFLFPTQAC